MEVILNQFIGYDLKAADGYIGKISDFYFDERTWNVRYLVVDTGKWLRREILISPVTLLEPDVVSKTFPVKTTKSKLELNQKANGRSTATAEYPSSCRRTETVRGSVIKAPEMVLGRVFDYILEDKNWQIRYLVIKVEKSVSRKLLLMDSRHLSNIYWAKEIIELNL